MAKAKAKQTEYAIMVEPLSDADGGGWLATVPALPGCMGDGDTPEAALADAEAAIIGDDVTVGHACIIHACTLEDGAFVGMGATVLDGAVIEAGGMLAAGGLLPPRKRIAAGELWAGSPAKLMRVMDAEERARFARTAVHYTELAQRHAADQRGG